VLFLLVTLLANYLVYKQITISYLSVPRSIYAADTHTTKMFSPALFQYVLSKPFFRLLLGHLAPLLLVYVFPLMITLYALFQFIREGNQKKILFIVIGLGQFIASFLLAIKYSVEIGQFTRVHARYYAMALPFFFISWFCFSDSIRWTIPKKIMLALAGLFTLVANIVFFLRYSSIQYEGGSIADNPDTTWFRFFPQTPTIKVLYFSLLVCFILLVLFFLLRSRPARAPYLVFLCLFIIIANFGHIKAMAMIETRLSPLSVPRHTLHQILQKTQTTTAITTIVWPELFACSRYSFWYPETKAMQITIDPKIPLTKAMLPFNTTTVILVGKYH
jgi:hypothetical protein